MSDLVDSPSELPRFPYFVVAQDTFLSGWGASKGMPNFVVLPCKTQREVDIVLENAENRTDMKDPQTLESKDMPRWMAEKSAATFSVFDREDADRWYTRGGFSRPNRDPTE